MAISEEFGQVVRSLLDNAIEAVGQSGAVSVKSHASEKDVTLEVADNGPGIAAETLGKIFSPFFTTKSGSGRGLGLSIVQSVVRNLGGTVDVNSRVGAGTTFRVRLPRHSIIGGQVPIGDATVERRSAAPHDIRQA